MYVRCICCLDNIQNFPKSTGANLIFGYQISKNTGKTRGQI